MIKKKSGFFKYLFEYEIRTHAKKKVDSNLSDEVIKRASTLIWKEERRCTGLQRVFIELMQNTNNHASNTVKGELLLNGDVHKTATGQHYRGKGLPGIFDACKNNKISNLIIISNDAIADYANDRYESLNNKLSLKYKTLKR